MQINLNIEDLDSEKLRTREDSTLCVDTLPKHIQISTESYVEINKIKLILESFNPYHSILSFNVVRVLVASEDFKELETLS
jgi:hypothetical protein